jgi:hypothetical protein
MKQYIGMGVNFAKSLKGSENDQNDEHVYAEVNVIFSEIKYDLSNTRGLTKSAKVDELELFVTADTARQIAESFSDIADKLEKLQVENEA